MSDAGTGTGAAPGQLNVQQPVNVNPVQVNTTQINQTQVNQPQIQLNTFMQSVLDWENDVVNDTREKGAFKRSESVVKGIFGEDRSLSWKNRTERKIAESKKRDLYKSAKNIMGQDLYTQPPAASAGVLSVEEIKSFLDTQVLFMSFTDDTAFMKFFNENYAELKRLHPICEKIKNISEAEYEEMQKSEGFLKDYMPERISKALGPLPSFEKIQEMAQECQDQKLYYEKKLELISNPFYTILMKDDLKGMKADDLQAKENEFRQQNRDSVADYFKISRELMELEKSGTKKETERFNWDSYKIVCHGGTNKRNQSYFKAGSRSVDLDFAAGIGGTGLSLAYKSKSDKDQNAMPEGAYLGGEANVEVKAKAAKASAKYQRRFWDVGANASVGAVRAHGGVGAGVGYNTSEGVKAQLGASGGVGVDTLKGRIKASLHFDKWINWFGLDFKMAGRGPSADIGGFVGFAKKDIDTFNTSEHKSKGFGFGGRFDASLASGSIGAGITVLGMRLGFTATGQVGAFGGALGGHVSTGDIGCEIGLLAGLGLNIKLELDWNDLLGALKKAGRKGISYLYHKIKD